MRPPFGDGTASYRSDARRRFLRVEKPVALLGDIPYDSTDLKKPPRPNEIPKTDSRPQAAGPVRLSSSPACAAWKETLPQKFLRHVFDAPQLRKPIWKFWYNLAARIDGGASHLKLMNFGYAPGEKDGFLPDLDPADEPHRNTIQMYYHTVGRKPLIGLDVLEVGCGRGGGAFSLMKYATPRILTGLDLSPKAVQLARKAYSLPGLDFQQGDAENLPFPDSSFDAAVNVESSHCYPNIRRFLAEVFRVLRPGGRFFYADFRRIADLPHWERSVCESGFQIKEKENITSDVVRALTQDSAKKEDLIRRRIRRFLHPAFRKFVCTVGSENYRSFIEGRRFYFRYLLVKAGIPSIVNFAPIRLKVPPTVFVEDLDVTSSIEKAAFFGRRTALKAQEMKK